MRKMPIPHSHHGIDGGRDFQSRVEAVVCRIPKGFVTSYGVVAGAVNCRSARVIGQALRRCQDPNVPCHRVIASGGKLGGFGGKDAGPAVHRKRGLLQAEGVRFEAGDRIAAVHILPDSPATWRVLARV